MIPRFRFNRWPQAALLAACVTGCGDPGETKPASHRSDGHSTSGTVAKAFAIAEAQTLVVRRDVDEKGRPILSGSLPPAGNNVTNPAAPEAARAPR
jgi:hypothetical protein